MKNALLLFLTALLIACSSGNGPDHKPVFSSAYFPLEDGDTWYFTNSASQKIVREVDGDTIINGISCIRVLENGETVEAWRIIETGDSAGFYVHMLTLVFNNEPIHPYFVPPLRIPFNMEVDEEYNYDSDGFYEQGGDQYTFTLQGKLVFKGFMDKTVPAGTFGDVARIHYETENYYEYYADGIGLLDNEDYVLDSAFIDGEWIR